MFDILLFVGVSLIIIFLAHNIGKNKGIRLGYNNCINDLLEANYISFKANSTNSNLGSITAYDPSIPKIDFIVRIKD